MTGVRPPTSNISSLLLLLNARVGCFEHVKFSRLFDRDFETCQLKFDIARLRLSRWGEAVEANQDDYFVNESDSDTKMAYKTLELLELGFKEAQLSSERDEITIRPGRPMALRKTSVAGELHRRLGDTAGKTQRQAGSTGKDVWTLYRSESFDRLLALSKEHLEYLEKLADLHEPLCHLAREAIRNIEDEPSLRKLANAATSTDEVLSNVVREKLENLSGGGSVHIGSDGIGRVQIGNIWAQNTPNVPPWGPVSNFVGSVEVSSGGSVRIGDEYRGFGLPR